MPPKGLYVLLFRYYINNQGEKRSTIIGTFKIRCKGTKYFSYMQTFLQKNFKKNQKKKTLLFSQKRVFVDFQWFTDLFWKTCHKEGRFLLEPNCTPLIVLRGSTVFKLLIIKAQKNSRQNPVRIKPGDVCL